MAEPPPPAIRVSTLELFFDLVFVFTIIQLAETLADDLSAAMLGNVLLILFVIWWMYSAYAWLTNAVAPSSTTRRTLLLTGMAGFLVMALAIPGAFGEYGWLFGVSYLMVTLVHAVLFRTAGPGARDLMRVFAPLNILAALLVLAGGLVPDPWRYLFWVAAPLVQIVAGYLHRINLHTISAGHFAERHGLVVIVAIGESILAIGTGFHGVPLGLGEILTAVLALCVAYYFWWYYFAGDDRRAEQVLAGVTEPGRRARLALEAWGFAHYPILLGVVIAAVGIKKTVGHAYEPLHWDAALALGGGVAVYLLGHAAFLRRLGLRGVRHRLAATALVLATVPLGHVVAIAQLAVVVVILVVVAIGENLPEIRRTHSTDFTDFGRNGT
ncbi:low temperature requirement protein A [Paractinoplanes rishiriensis]|uniref:Low temperature requirement protein A n=1 Tax=Paractinoplanes rishiriensis TaxID=1050105 RepID=A0A919K507_9ACTN|nr:low temperature requirement protein A [Actinoplanes rishiriensis]GIE96731.1 low temperature requirement protein A [Actinoplanes rishiriensis]